MSIFFNYINTLYKIKSKKVKCNITLIYNLGVEIQIFFFKKEVELY